MNSAQRSAPAIPSICTFLSVPFPCSPTWVQCMNSNYSWEASKEPLKLSSSQQLTGYNIGDTVLKIHIQKYNI